MRAVAIIAAILAVSVSAGSIKWTGLDDNAQWDDAKNWHPAQVPGPNDDVIIASGNVQVTVPAAINSLVIGTEVSSTANLTIFQAFVVANTASIEQNGNLYIGAGSSSFSGTVTVTGNLYFSAGTLSGSWTIARAGSAWLNSNSLKGFSAATFSSGGTLLLGGVLQFNQSSTFTVASSATASGDFTIQNGDGSAVQFNAAGTGASLTYTGGGTFQIQCPVALGTFDFQAGNLTLYDDVNFVNAFIIPAGSVVATVSTANVNITNGLWGTGTLTATGANLQIASAKFNGTLNLGAGAVTFIGTNSSWVNNFNVMGGTIVINGPAVFSKVSILAGTLQGTSPFVVNAITIATPGFNLNGALTVQSAGWIPAATLIAFGPQAAITISAAAQFTVNAAFTLTGAPGSAGVTNNGAFNVNAATGFQNINVGGTGTFNVANTLSLSSISFTQATVALTGTGAFKGASTDLTSVATISASPSVTGVIGGYTLSCPKECDNISTNGTPIQNFEFTVGSSMMKHRKH